MSTTVDQRVVEMRFDNQNFERNVSNTMSSLEKLKQSLRFTGVTKGFQDIDAAAKGVNMSGLGTAVETVGLKFSAMYTVADQALRNITNSAIRTGERIVSALTIDPIKTGFSEYETQINSVQTILANTESKGTTLGDVNKALDTLNAYADKTIYNFTEMTRNIGTFTAAGTDLETSVNAIQGIANLAAVSGSTSQQASTAMYQLSQALASGTVKLMDWNSVVNAGMGGQVFQDALKETARVHGVAIDQMIKDEGSFRETLKNEWLTSEILTETLSKFTMATEGLTDAQIEQNRQMLKSKGYTDEQIESIFKLGNTATNAATKVKTFTQLWDTLKEAAQSGWTQTWETVVGDFGEAKELLTEISEVIGGVIGRSAESRNSLLSGALDSNWKKLTNAISDAGIETDVFEEKIRKIVNDDKKLDGLIEKHGSLANVFKDGALSSDILTKALDGLGKSTADLSIISKDLKKGNVGEEVKQAQQALSDLGYDLGKAGVDGVFGGATEKAIKAFQEANKLEVTGIIDESTLAMLEKTTGSMNELSESCKGFIDNITELGGRENIIQSMWNMFEGLKSVITPIGEAFREIFPALKPEQLYAFTESLKEFTSKLKLSEEQSAKLKSTFKGLFAGVDIVFTAVKEIGGGIVELLSHVVGFSNGILNTTGSFGDWISNLRDSIKETDIFGNAIDKVVGFLTNIIDKLKEFGVSVKEGFAAEGYVGFYGFLKLIWDFVSKIASAVSNAFTSISENIANVFGGSYIDNLINTGLFTGLLLGVKKIVDTLKDILDGGGGFLENITDMIDDVRGCFEAYQNNLNAQTLGKIAAAIALLAASIFVIASIDSGKLETALGAITVLFIELLGAMTAFTKISAAGLKGALKASILMTGMATAILILAAAMKVLSSVEPEGILTGLLAIGIMMAEMSLFLRYAEFDGKIGKAAAGMVLISTAMLIMAKAVASFGALPLDQLIKGVSAIGVVLALLSGFAYVAGKSGNLMSAGAAMVMIGASMKIFASAVKDFATMNVEELKQGLYGMAGALAAVTIAVKFMPKNMVGIGAGLVIVGAAMLVLAQAVKSFASMKVDEIERSLITLGVSLAILSGALFLMRNSITGSAALIIAAGAIAILAPALKMLGEMSVGQIAKSLITLALAFTVIGVAGYVLAPIVPALLGLAGACALFSLSILGLGVGLTIVAAGITALSVAVGAGATAIVAGLSVILVGIADLIPQLARKLGEGVIEVAKVIGEHAPVLAESALKLILEVLQALEEYAPQIVESLAGFLIGVLDALAGKLPDLIKSAVNVISAFFKGVVDALSGLDTSSLIKGIAGVALMSGLMLVLSMVTSLIPGAMLGVLGMGVVIAELALVLAAIGALSTIPGLEWLINKGGDFLQTIGTAIGKFFGGIAGGVAEGVSAALPQIGSDMSAFMTNAQPFIDGAKQLDASMLEGVKALAGAILTLTAANVLDGIASWITGGSSLNEFGEELAEFGGHFNSYYQSIKGVDGSVVAASANAALALAEMASALPNAGGMASWFAGENSLSDFADELVKFGPKIKKYADSVSGIDSDAVVSSANAGKALAEMAENLPNSGGAVSWFTGDNDISAFGDGLVKFGKSMASFSNEVKDINTVKMSGAINQFKNIVNVVKGMNGINFGVLTSFSNGLTQLGEANVDGFVKAFEDGYDRTSKAITTMLDGMINGVKAKTPEFTPLGTNIITKFTDGISKSAPTVLTIFTKAISSVIVGIRNSYSDFYNAGAYLVEGFANGISGNTYKAAAKAKAMAIAAENAAKKELEVNSPSKVGDDIGNFFGIGFVNGIARSVSTAYKTSFEMASAAKEGLGSAISKIANTVETGIDSQPTIRPILDLSDVKSGIGTMNGLLNTNASVGLLADISSISSSMNVGQNGANDDVVSAIDKLREQMDTVRGDTYNLGGITYSEGSELADAIQTIVRVAKIERRV